LRPQSFQVYKNPGNLEVIVRQKAFLFCSAFAGIVQKQNH
jgi:hypothetical protein